MYFVGNLLKLFFRKKNVVKYLYIYYIIYIIKKNLKDKIKCVIVIKRYCILCIFFD